MLGRDILGKSGSLLSFIFLILLCVYTRAEEEIKKSGTCQELSEISAEIGSAGWSSVNQGSTCSYCNSRDTKKSWLVIKRISSLKSDQKANIKIVAQTSKCTDCKNFQLKVYVLFGSLKSDTKAQLVAQLSNLTSLIGKFENDKIEQQQTHYMQYVSKPDQSRLVFLAEGGCFVIYSIQISTFYCKEDVINGVRLTKLDSLANRSRRFNYSCPKNSQPSHNEVFGLCTSNGTWEVKESCLCFKGSYLKENDGCQCCPKNTYKDSIGNYDCKSCPDNSQSTKGQFRCNCKSGYYRFLGNNDTHACHGIPSSVTKVQFAFKTTTSVQIKWQAPIFRGGSDVFYEIRCFKCEGDNCKTKCRDATTFLPAKDNLTTSSVIVKNLEPYTKYLFVIYSKNVNNIRIDETKWKGFNKKIYTKGCPENTYKEYIGNDDCKSCPENSQSAKGQLRCDCKSGYYRFLGDNYTHACYSRTERLNETTDSDCTTILSVALSIAVVALLLGLLIGIFWKWRKNQNKKESTFPVELESMPNREIDPMYAEVDPPRANDISSMLALFQDVQRSDEFFWEFPRKRLTILRKLGEGSFGTVNKAKWTPIHAITGEKGGIVAVKMLKENASLTDERDFISELNLMKKLEPHPHVVQLLGCCTNSEPFFLILEYLVGGDLLGYLRKSRGYEDPYNTGEYVPTSRLREKDLLSFAWMISEGMNYLSSEGIVHRDLAARNILVGEDNICKVSDFGLAREGTYVRKSKARLPAKWMAPEDLLHGQCTSMSDIWSYGILLWEIFTIGDSPYPGVKGRDVFRLIESGFRMPKPSHFSDKLYSLMMDCWNDEPIKRPKFSYISSFFHKMLEDFTAKAYLDLTKFDDHHYENFDIIE